MTYEETFRRQEVFCDTVKYLAKEHGGIGKLEEAIGVSPGYISRVRKDRRGISMNKVMMICDILGRTFEELCDEGTLRKAEAKAIDLEIARLEARKKRLEEKDLEDLLNNK